MAFYQPNFGLTAKARIQVHIHLTKQQQWVNF